MPLACAQLPGFGGSQVTVSVALHSSAAAAPTLRVDLGGQSVAIGPVGYGAGGASVSVRGPRYGERPIHAALLAPAGDTLGSVAFTQRFHRWHRHWVAAVIGTSRPVGSCVGELVVAPVRGGADTLFVTYGSLPDGAVC
jgi:hypothetical protein